MSIAAMNWAWNQNIPHVAAKLLLMALADQTDQRDGSVRYQETFAQFFSAKCTISVRTFWSVVGLLELNRYLERSGHRGGGRGKATEFRLLLDRPASSLEDWRKDKSDDENCADLAHFSDEKLCQIVQESVQDEVINRATENTVSEPIHNTNYESTKVRTNARARARASSARAPARKEVAAVPGRRVDPLDTVFPGPGLRSWLALVEFYRANGGMPQPRYVCHETEQWRDLKAYCTARGQAMPKGLYRGEEPNQFSGCHFPAAHIRKAGEEAKARATGPPDGTPSDASEEESSDGGGDVGSGRQSATGLRGVAGSVADRGRDRPGADQSAYG